MKIRAIAIVVFLALVSVSLAVHFRQQSVVDEKNKEHIPPPSDIPVPPKTGPFGKFVVIGETTHNFGVMELGQEGSFQFKVRNEGAGPLQMVARKEDHTCQCTLGSLGQDGLKPGEETNVTLSWKIKNPASLFEHSAKIRTDDPDNPVTTFRVRGFVGRRLIVTPGSDMNIGTISEQQPTERTMGVHSEVVEAFEITKIETSTPLISTTIRALTAEELQNSKRGSQDEKNRLSQRQVAENMLQGAPPEKRKEMEDMMKSQLGDDSSAKAPDAKCGYEIKVAFQSGFPIGRFRESLNIHTTIPSGSEPNAAVSAPVIVNFEGTRAGPVQILGSTGSVWSPEEGILRLGRFAAKEGKKARLLVFIKKTEQELEITDAKLDPPFLKYSWTKDVNFKQSSRDKFDLMIEVSPSDTPVSLSGGDKQGLITLQTNHPEAKTIKLAVEFTSY